MRRSLPACLCALVLLLQGCALDISAPPPLTPESAWKAIQETGPLMAKAHPLELEEELIELGALEVYQVDYDLSFFLVGGTWTTVHGGGLQGLSPEEVTALLQKAIGESRWQAPASYSIKGCTLRVHQTREGHEGVRLFVHRLTSHAVQGWGYQLVSNYSSLNWNPDR